MAKKTKNPLEPKVAPEDEHIWPDPDDAPILEDVITPEGPEPDFETYPVPEPTSPDDGSM